ncbi:alpha/beta hydrolase [Gleimia hominis]|uniref:Alpha/beta hydrolase n=1 Tax=Gleimia hominis TaxID=595468 RepID=A0ABU3I8H4_9ACTO|nr:alpha/beta hydrolase [Gleimia hominis]MDT3766676.1 alpha/beta hydrolase [Gleimia hominis]
MGVLGNAIRKLLTAHTRQNASKPGDEGVQPPRFGAQRTPTKTGTYQRGHYQRGSAHTSSRSRPQTNAPGQAQLHHYYSARQVPETMLLIEGARQLAPLIGRLAGNAAAGIFASLPVWDAGVRAQMEGQVAARGEQIVEDSQRVFFDMPGLDTLVIQAVCRVAHAVSAAYRSGLRVDQLLHPSHSSQLAERIARLPRGGYESFMSFFLAAGTAMGRFRGGDVRADLMYEDGRERPLPRGHAHGQVRRFTAPESLQDMAADIDDIYWAETTGAIVKITRVGAGPQRRWLISIPGTDSVELRTTHNPAGTETNIREMLGLRSAVRMGVLAAFRQAMEAEGLDPAGSDRERVTIVGHSQGGMVALGLLQEQALAIDGIVTLGVPGRRVRIPAGVTAIAVEHDQDVIPAFDGRPRRLTTDRVVVGRRLNRPRSGALYYAHSSATYTDTIRLLERRARVEPFSRMGRAVRKLQEQLAHPGEQTRVYHFEISQDILEGGPPSIDSVYEHMGPVWQPPEVPLPGFGGSE